MNETINQRIFYYRKLAGITQAEAAEQMGMKLSTYSQMERKGKITTDKLLKIAKILNVNSDILLNGSKAVHNSENVAPVETEAKVSDTPAKSNNVLKSPVITIPDDTYIPTNRELSTMQMIHNLPKHVQEEIFTFIHKKYEENR
ncbi:MAG: helix-turn-helix domain-containing protein [Acutalibacteraceae bacterium]|nr:helix-turn-helix domain-containing protein [Acutalibacteraceae bacterium]